MRIYITAGSMTSARLVPATRRIRYGAAGTAIKIMTVVMMEFRIILSRIPSFYAVYFFAPIFWLTYVVTAFPTRIQHNRKEVKHFAGGSMGSNDICTKFVDGALKRNRSDIDDTAHKSHRKRRLDQIAEIFFGYRIFIFLWNQKFASGKNKYQACNTGNSL